jgi:hypothetical protein
MMVSYQCMALIIIDVFERKGKLYKKSLNSDVFKKRIFVLERENLFYFNSDRKLIFLYPI